MEKSFFTFKSRKASFDLNFGSKTKKIRTLKIVQVKMVNPFIRVQPGNCIVPMIFSSSLTTDYTDSANSDDILSNAKVTKIALRLPLRDYTIDDLVATINDGIDDALDNNNVNLSQDNTTNLTFENDIRNASDYNGITNRAALTSLKKMIYLEFDQESAKLRIINKLYRTSLIIPGLDLLYSHFLNNSTAKNMYGSIWPTLGFPHNGMNINGTTMYTAKVRTTSNALGNDYYQIVPSVLNTYLSGMYSYNTSSPTDFFEGNSGNSEGNPLVTGNNTVPDTRNLDSEFTTDKPAPVLNLSVNTTTNVSGVAEIETFATPSTFALVALDTQSDTFTNLYNEPGELRASSFVTGAQYTTAFSLSTTVHAVVLLATFAPHNPQEFYSPNFHMRNERVQYGACETVCDSPMDAVFLRIKGMDCNFDVAQSEKKYVTSTVLRERSGVTESIIETKCVTVDVDIPGIIAKIPLSAPGSMCTDFVSSVYTHSGYLSASKKKFQMEVLDSNGNLVDPRGTVMTFVLEAEHTMDN